MTYKKQFQFLLLISALIHLAVASSIELGNDEVYYWTYSQNLQWNYFDHPPMVALLIRIFTVNLTLQQFEIFIRLGSIVCCMGASWFLFQAMRRIHGEKAAFIAACLYHASIYASIIAGLFIMPDSPQMICWSICLYLLSRIFSNEGSWKLWLAFGFAAGLSIMSKIHGVFIWFGLGLYILIYKRQWLTMPQLYVAFFLTVLLIAPIIFWNFQYDFITYRFHSERVTVKLLSFNRDSFFREFFGQILFNNPINVFISFCALRFWYQLKTGNKELLKIFNLIALPMIILLLGVSAFRDTLPHWSGPAYVTLIPLASIWLADKYPGEGLPKIVKAALVFITVVVLSGTAIINFFPGSFGSKNKGTFGEGDFSLDMYGWRKAGIAFSKIYAADTKKLGIADKVPVVCFRWFPAAHEEYYCALPYGIQMAGLGTMNDLHQYMWRNHLLNDHLNMSLAYCIVPTDNSYSPQEKYKDYYSNIDSIASIPIERSGKLSRYFNIYRLSGWKGKLPVVVPKYR